MIEVLVESIRVNMTNYKRVLMLKDKAAQRYLPIWIGQFEADAIAIPMHNVPTNRPLTHDMLIAAIGQLGGRCVRAEITRLEDETYYATLVADQSGQFVEIDCRPSDAVSAAVRAKVPIFVADDVMDRAAMTLEAVQARPRSRNDASVAMPETEAVVDEATVDAYWPGAEPAGGSAPKPFDTLTAVSEPVLAALTWSADDVARRKRRMITCGDMLLGLLEQRHGAANRVLVALSVEPAELQTLVRQGAARDLSTAVLTGAALTALQRAVEEAHRLDEDTVRSEHLLLALASETEGSVPAALDKIGLTAVAIRRQVAVLLAQAAAVPPGETSPGAAPADEAPSGDEDATP